MAIKIGQTVQVTTSAGLRARTSPNGPVRKKDGKQVLRPRGFKFKVRALKNAGGRQWAQAAELWYATEFLGAVVTAAKVATPVPGYKATTPWRKKPNNRTYWQSRGYHTGTDFAAPTGANVVAVRAGTVRHHSDRVLGTIQLLWADNGETFWYCHLSSRIANGTKVKAGQRIGKVGATGTGANGPHLHLERRSGHGSNWGGADLNPLVW